jgi:hypothetical protein
MRTARAEGVGEGSNGVGEDCGAPEDATGSGEEVVEGEVAEVETTGDGAPRLQEGKKTRTRRDANSALK